jgi:hypothetical protein
MNIAEILKYCPKGTKLYSLVHGEVTLEEIKSDVTYPIKVALNDKISTYYTKDGLFFIKCGECVLFPSKTQRDWNKFRIPIKRGDVMMKIDGTSPFIATGEMYNDISPKYICGINSLGNFQIDLNKEGWTSTFYIPASEEARKELFIKMGIAGYTWNTNTLELEKIENKLKKQEFKLFDKVLVRDEPSQKWAINLFSYYDEEDEAYPYVCLNERYLYCIPYEGNEHLLGTIDNIK